MAEENSFKENLNWKKLSIDAINTIIATAIGIVIGLLVDKAKEDADKAENYQKIIVATINNLENYEKQIEDKLEWIEYHSECFNQFGDDNYAPETSVLDDLGETFYTQDFMQQDRWIEENFIANGNFIENTDLRLKIGNVYSLIDLAKANCMKLSELSSKASDKYLEYSVSNSGNDGQIFVKTIQDKDYLSYAKELENTKTNLACYLTNIQDLNAEIVKMSKADEKALNEMREASKKINETISKGREAVEGSEE